MPATIRVFITDDHAAVRAGLKRLLSATPDLEVVGEAADGVAMLDAAAAGAWDVLVLDLGMPRMTGLEALRRVRAMRPSLPIVVLSAYADACATRVMRAGAARCLSKDLPAEAVLTAIREAAGPRGSIPPTKGTTR